MFRETKPSEIEFNVFKEIDKTWMLICADDKDNERCNLMTASWGGMGTMWKRNVCTLLVRPQRHTYKLCEENDRLSVCFLPEEYREALNICGRESGRNIDKFERTGLTHIKLDGVSCVAESSLVLLLKKIYVDDLKKENFIGNIPSEIYPRDDYHRIYVCEITKAYISE